MLAALLSPNASLAFGATIRSLIQLLCRLRVLTLQLLCQDLLKLSTGLSLVVESFASNASTTTAFLTLHDSVLVAEFVDLNVVTVRVSAPVKVWLTLKAVFAHVFQVIVIPVSRS